MKKVFKFVKGRKDDKRENAGIAPSLPGEIISPEQTPDDDKFLCPENSFGYSVDFGGKDKTLTKLHKAAWQGSLEKLKSALKKADIDAVDRRNRTALHFAVVQGHPNIVWFLLGNNAKTTVCDDEGRTPLLKAVEYGHKECMTLLLERGANVNVADYTGNTCLHIATAQGSPENVSALLQKGADTEISNNAGDYPLHIATKLENKDLICSFLTSGASVDVLDRENRTPLMLAAKTGNLLLAELFAKRGAQLSIVDSNGWTALDYALLGGYEDVLALLKPFAEPKTQSSEGENASQDLEMSLSKESNGSWNESQVETSEKGSIARKLKELFEQCPSENVESDEKPEDSESPTTEMMPPYCQPPRSWDMIQAGMIDENTEGSEPKRRSITALGTLRTRRESFTESSVTPSPQYTLSLNRKKSAKINNSFAKQRFSFNAEESLKFWLTDETTVEQTKDPEQLKVELAIPSIFKVQNFLEMAKVEEKSSVPDCKDGKLGFREDEKVSELTSNETRGSGSMEKLLGPEEKSMGKSHFSPSNEKKSLNSWDSEDTSLGNEGSFPPPPTALELGADLAKSIKYLKGISEDHTVVGAAEKNLWRNVCERHSLDRLKEKDSSEVSQASSLREHVRHGSMSAQKWEKQEKPRDSLPHQELSDVSKRISEQLECYDQALRELAESSKSFTAYRFYSLPSSKNSGFDYSQRTRSLGRGREKRFVDSGPFSMPFFVNGSGGKPPLDADNNESLGSESLNVRLSIKKDPASGKRDYPSDSGQSIIVRPGEKSETKTKRQMLLAMREVKHAVQVANTFRTSLDDQILSPLKRPEEIFDVTLKGLSSSSEEISPGEENPFFGLGRQETVMEKRASRRESCSSETAEEPTLWLQDDPRRKEEQQKFCSSASDDDVPEIPEELGTRHARKSSFSPLGAVFREIQEYESEHETSGRKEPLVRDPVLDCANEKDFREPSPDVSLSSGPIEPFTNEKDSGSEPESCHYDISPTRDSLKVQHEWLRRHLKTATSEKNKLEEITAQLSEKTERLRYELADAKEAAKSRDEVIHLLRNQLAKMEAAYTKSLEETVQSRLQLTSHEQEILHLKELCYRYEEEKESAVLDLGSGNVDQLEAKIRLLEEEKKRMQEEIVQLEQEKASLEMRLKEAADSESMNKRQRWKERFKLMEESPKPPVSFDENSSNECCHQKSELNLRQFFIEKRLREISAENSVLKVKIKKIAEEAKRKKANATSEREIAESVCQLKKKHAEIEDHLKSFEVKIKEEIMSELGKKEEVLETLLRHFNTEKKRIVESYERRSMQKPHKDLDQEMGNPNTEYERLKQVVKSIQHQFANIPTNSSNEDAWESLKNELSDLNFQCNVAFKSSAELQMKNQLGLNSMIEENFKLKEEMLKTKTKKSEESETYSCGQNPKITHENAQVKNEIWNLKNQVNSLKVLLRDKPSQKLGAEENLRGVFAERNRWALTEQKVKKRVAGKEDQLAWSSLYGMESARNVSSMPRSSIENFERKETKEVDQVKTVESLAEPTTHQNLQFLHLKKEVRSLQNRILDEKHLREALETQMMELNLSLKDSENLQQEIHFLKKKIDKDCIRKSEAELLRCQRDFDSKLRNITHEEENKATAETYKAKCVLLAKEREKSKEIKAKVGLESLPCESSAHSLSVPPFRFSPLRPERSESVPQSSLPVTAPAALDSKTKTKLENELERSIKRHLRGE